MNDDELLEFASEFREGIIDGVGGGQSDFMCAAICWPLVTILNMQGVPCESVTTDNVETDYGSCNHVWIRLADGRALDPTADQFNNVAREYPPVYLGPPTELHT